MQSAKRDFGTLCTDEIAYEGLIKFEATRDAGRKAELLSQTILAVFTDYYRRSRELPWLAKKAFETRDWTCSLELSQERIAIYSVAISKCVAILKQAILENDRAGGFWEKVEIRYQGLLHDRYEADLALAFLASVRRVVYQNTWMPIPYDHDMGTDLNRDFVRSIQASGEMMPELATSIIAVLGIDAPFLDLPGDAARVADRINKELEISSTHPLDSIEVVEAGFYRNRGAYVIGALEIAGRKTPMALALLHGEKGIEIDAVILRETTLRHVFSSTLANMHVTMTEYHELVGYMHELMPTRPLGMHYSTIGYNHVGKIAVMDQLARELKQSAEQLDYAPGPRGSVAIGFTSPSSSYVLKVIRDKPTDQYKWDRFDGADHVLAKYRRVHELNRSGSMLDNIIYSNIWLPLPIFGEALLQDLMNESSETVSLYRDGVFFSHLIVQRKLIPLPLFLQDCTPQDAETVVIRLGQCIRNNAATNVFNKDLDGRNYGVSSLRFIYLFDYDAIETLTDVKIRTNTDREYGEEEPPDWFFEDGIIFLPEEIETHLKLPDRGLRRLFREAHGELLTVDYWTRMQKLLQHGHVPRVRTYPRADQLNIDRVTADLTMSPQS